MEKQLIPIKNTTSAWHFTSFVSLVLLVLLLLASSAAAQTWFIKPSTEVPLRRGKGIDYKILAIVPDGTEVTIVEENEPWAKVVTKKGKEGWILKRFLSIDAPLQQVVETLLIENTNLKEEHTVLTNINDSLGSLNNTLQEQLDDSVAELTRTRNDYQALMQDTADVILIKNNLSQSRKTIATLQRDLGTVSADNKQLKASQNIKWFLAGGGTLILGCIVGMIISRSRKRKSSFY